MEQIREATGNKHRQHRKTVTRHQGGDDTGAGIRPRNLTQNFEQWLKEAEDTAGGWLQDAEAAAEDMFAGALRVNLAFGLRPMDLASSLRRFAKLLAIHPGTVVQIESELMLEFARIAMGKSAIERPGNDFRFKHPIWGKNPYYRRVMQSYLAWRGSLYQLLEASEGEPEDKARAEFFLMQLTEAMSPTNRPTGNPGFLDSAIRTRGKSVLRGASNFVNDMLNNGGLPKQVDDRPFQVGKTLATTEGAVVYRCEMFELIQYTPKTEKVYRKPVLLVPPQINKFYIVDLAPEKSFVRFAVENGVQLFVMSWRNPTREHKDWGFESYVSATGEALDVVREIAESDEANVIAACAAGITTTALLGHLWASGRQHKAASLTLLVTILDTSVQTTWSLFATPPAMRAAAARSRRKGIVDGETMGRTFSWLRPNDLVWGFFANNYLMGNQPPAFDFLYWNSDSTRLPGNFHADLIELFERNPLRRDGGLRVLGTDIKPSRIDCDSFVVAGIKDHIVPWRACYNTTQILGGDMEFLLSSSGHIQSVVNPPSKPKSKYYSNKRYVPDADQWLEAATEHQGSWWTRWLEWIAERSGGKKPAPRWLGDDTYRPGDRAPGRYVHQH